MFVTQKSQMQQAAMAGTQSKTESITRSVHCKNKSVVSTQSGYSGCRQAGEVVRRRGSETNCIRELERMMVQIIYNHSCVILTTKHL